MYVRSHYIYCYWRPALMGDCTHWQPAIAVIIVQFVIDVYLVNKLFNCPWISGKDRLTDEHRKGTVECKLEMGLS